MIRTDSIRKIMLARNILTFMVALAVIFSITACDQEEHGNLPLKSGSIPTDTSSSSRSSAPVQCSQADVDCKYFSDFLEKKSGFKEQLAKAFNQSKITQPTWIQNGTSMPAYRSQVDGESYVIAFICEPHNCSNNSLVAAFGEKNNNFIGLLTRGKQFAWVSSSEMPVSLIPILCNAVSLVCNRQGNLSPLWSTLKKERFLGDASSESHDPTEMLNMSFFKDCKETYRFHHTCNEQYIPKCPYSSSGCMVAAWFVDGMLHSLSFEYEVGSVDSAEMQRAFDHAYGKSSVEHQNDMDMRMESWSLKWMDGDTKISMLRLRGININNEPYDNLSVSFEDATMPEFFADVRNAR